jgi:hypothetical protein
VSVNVGVVSTGSGTIALTSSPSTLTVSQGNAGTETITVTPGSGYTGTVDLTFDAGSGDSALQNLCYEFTNMNSAGDGTVAISGTAAGTTQLSFDTNAADCVSTDAVRTGKQPFRALHKANTSKNNGTNPAPLAVAFAGLLLAGFLGRYARRFRSLAGLIALLAVGLGLSACSSVSNTISNPPTGTYTITVTGQDSATSTITATTQFTFTITNP